MNSGIRLILIPTPRWLFLSSLQLIGGKPEYKKRWQIEELFACLKSRGFNFEDTHLTNPTKISKIMAILTLAFLWAVKTGQWLHQVKPIRQKTTLPRQVTSIFR